MKVFLFLFTGVILFSCSTPSASGDHASATKFDQYYVHGQELYVEHCSNCHQKTGTGLGRVYPPLAVSDYMKGNFEAVVCLIRKGKKGELVVNGATFNQAMPGIPTLTDLEIAEIATYIFNSWGHEKGIVEVQLTTKILNNCGDLP